MLVFCFVLFFCLLICLFVCFKGGEEKRLSNSGHSGKTLIAPLMARFFFSSQLVSHLLGLPSPIFSAAPTSNTQSFYTAFSQSD